MKHLRSFSNEAEYNANLFALDKPSVVHTTEDNKVYFPDMYFMKFKHNGVISDRVFFCGAYADGDDCYFMTSHENNSSSPTVKTNRGVYKFNYNDPTDVEQVFKGIIGEGAENYELVYAGKDFDGGEFAVSFPAVRGEQVSDPNYIGLVQGRNNWANPIVELNAIDLIGTSGERICPSSKPIIYNDWIYIAGYDYSTQGFSSNMIVRRAYICRTKDWVNFETKPLLDLRPTGTITSMSTQTKQLSETDIFITPNGECHFVVRAVGDYTSTSISNANAGYYYGHISNIEEYFTWDGYIEYTTNYDLNPCLWGESFEELPEDTREEIPLKVFKFVDTSAISAGGHLQGVLPRIIFNHRTNSPMVILYARCDPNKRSLNQLYLQPNPLVNEYIKIGKGHPNNNNNSPQGGNMGVCVWKDSVFIGCPHDKTDEVNIFVIPMDILSDLNTAKANLPKLEDGEAIEIQL